MITTGMAALYLTMHTVLTMLIIWDNKGKFPYKDMTFLIAEYMIIVLIMYLTQNL